MLISALKKPIACAAVLGAVGLAAMAPAHALTVGARWDPRYGAPFLGPDPDSVNDDMWWSGSASMFIPTECIVGSVAGQTLTCDGMLLKDAKNELRTGEFGDSFETLDFGARGTVKINSVTFDAFGQVKSIDTNYFEPLIKGTKTDFSVNLYEFSFGISNAGALLFHLDPNGIFKHDHTGHDDADRFWNGVGKGHLAELCPSPGKIKNSTTSCGFSENLGIMKFDQIVYNAVPEPGTSALLLAASGAAALAMRRRRRD